MVKLQEVRGKWTITVPTVKVKRKKWKKGQELDWVETATGDLVLVEV